MKKWFWNLNLKRKFFLLILLMVMVMVLLEAFNRQSAYNTYNQMLYEENARTLMIYMDYIENIFDRMENITYLMIADSDLQENLMYLRDHFEEENWISCKSAVSREVSSYAYREKYFSSFILKTDFLTFGFGNKMSANADMESYLETVSDANGQIRMIPGEQQLILVREIRQSANLKLTNLAYIIAQVDFPAIVEDVGKTLKHADIPLDISVYNKDFCLYASDPENALLEEKEDGWYISGKDFITVCTSDKLGFTMVIRTPYGRLKNSIRSVYWRSLFLSFLVALTAFAIGSVLVRMMIRDISGLIGKMDEFGAGRPLDAKEGERYRSRKDEIGKMYRHFYKMASDYRKLMEEYYDSRLLLKEAEFDQMQKQIQPHFLFNTLTAISWMAYAHKDEETAHMVETLGRMMRKVTDNKQSVVTVESDLEMVEDYLSIQQFRFRNRLAVEIQISPETRKLMIPRLSMQPLVENSVTYAMEEQLLGCRIRIFDRINPEYTEIIVEDNGPGFDGNILEELENGTQKAKGTGTALRNIHKRLQYTFSEEYGLSFHRLEDGMQVIIRIPGNISEKTEERGKTGIWEKC